jgi:predicted dehydrogenase
MPLKVCLIGAGHMGRIHALKLSQMKDIHLTSIVDVNTAQAEEIAGQHQCCFYDTCSDAISGGARAAVIASTTDTHYPLAMELLNHNVHVFIEKPIAAEPAQARQMIDLATRKGLVLQVGHLERFSPPFRKAQPLINEPCFIEAYRISGFTGRSTDIDVIHDLMIHDIDLALSLAKSPVRTIEAHGTSVFTSMIDTARAQIEFENGCMASLTASRASTTKERSMKILQRDAFFSLDLALGSMYFTPTRPGGKRIAYRAKNPDPVNDELKSFFKTIHEKGKPLVDGEDGLRALLLANAISRRIEENGAGAKSHVI